MTGILALVGGGEWTEGCTFDRRMIAETGATEVVVMPTGAAYETPSRLIDDAQRWFGAMNVDVVEVPVLTRRDALVAEFADVIRSAKFIYLAGSSGMHLRSVLKDTPVFDAVLAAWENGAALVGTNGGADVLCDPMVDSRGGAFTVGLGVINQLSVIPRVEEWSREKVHRTVELAPKGLSLAGVPTRTALIREPDGAWTAEGAQVDLVSVFINGEAAVPSDLRA
ncbi:MAG: Type 1 glutamine amidotransferase-like domain-containing protein [Actinomycetes bacterium]